MPRQARMTSATCVYHTILRGVNKQQVFENEEDYLRFLNVLRRQTQLYVDDQAFHILSYKGLQVGHSVATEWFVSLSLMTRS